MGVGWVSVWSVQAENENNSNKATIRVKRDLMRDMVPPWQ
jgi:hypothetical protein